MNAFILPVSSSKVTVADLKKHFGNKETHYHLRFLTKIGNNKCWVDTTKDNSPVPLIDGHIKIKILKLPQGIKPKIIKQVPKEKNLNKQHSMPAA